MTRPNDLLDAPEAAPDDEEQTKIRRAPMKPAADAAVVLQAASLVVVYVPLENAAMAADLGRRVPIGGPVTIGRHPGNVLVLEQDEVSRRHAEVFVREGLAYVRDLGSRNGTQVNDVDLQGAARPLVDGDRITVGTTILKFIQSDTENQFHEVIYRLKVEDALTRIHNKRYLMEFLERELSRASRHHSPLSLVIYDLDHFKKINDTHGHLAGDLVLRESAAVVKPLIRKEECYARYGGEEFCLVQPEMPLGGAAQVAEKIRAAIEGARFIWDGVQIPVTVSLGVAQLPEGMTDPAELIRIADERLYKAKHGGRNRVVSA
jgi:two-component system cell cycle response regulator